MSLFIQINNILAVLALISFVVMIILMKRVGSDERAQYMAYMLFSRLFIFLLGGLSVIIVITGWRTLDYAVLRICITSLMSLTMFVALGYWVYISKKV